MGTNQDDVLLEDNLEDGFNDALADLRKSLNLDEEKPLRKAEDSDEEEEPEEDEETEEDEDEESYQKSISDILAEDPEAAAAMDVEPFLAQLAKAIDESIGELNKSFSKKISRVEKLAKSQANVVLQSAELQKSMRDMVEQIGGQPLPTSSVRRLNKSRFNGGDDPQYNSRDVLTKSREWLRGGKIDLTEAGMIESRLNKGLLGRQKDALDQKVTALMKVEE